MIAEHHLTQLTAQSLLLEKKYDTVVSHAKIIYFDELQPKLIHTEKIEITLDMKRAILHAIDQIREMHETEIIPDSLKKDERKKCDGCEYWNYCRGV